MVLASPFLGDDRFNKDAKAISITAAFSLDKVQKEVRARHGLPPSVTPLQLLVTLPWRAWHPANLADRTTSPPLILT